VKGIAPASAFTNLMTTDTTPAVMGRFARAHVSLGSRTAKMERVASMQSQEAEFSTFMSTTALRLRRVLAAQYGVDVGGDLHADAMTYAWQHWDRIKVMANPIGYLYRVAQSASRPHRRWTTRNSFPAAMPEIVHTDSDPTLFASLGSLSEAQRVAVLMVHGHGWSYAEVADTLGTSVTAVTNHVHRGLAKLRREMEVN
jgi:RNA polymerase sigma factor (sigma-70 family)